MKGFKTKLSKLLQASLDATAKGHHTFMDYSGHIDCVYVRVYLNGWVANRDYNKRFEVYLNNDDASAKIWEATKYLNNLPASTINKAA